MTREITKRYSDPLDMIWTATADRVGFRIERSEEVFASVKDGVITIGAPSTLDADDCLAQMIFHELCHSMVQGREHLHDEDFGLDNIGEGDEVRELACLRLQAALAGDYGLTEVLAPTTDFREHYDDFKDAPLEGDHPSVALAKEAYPRVKQTPWAPHLLEALGATRQVLKACAPFSDESDLFSIVPAKDSQPIV